MEDHIVKLDILGADPGTHYEIERLINGRIPKGIDRDTAIIEWNQETGFVYIIDEDYNIATYKHGSGIEMWYICQECGLEGFIDDLDSNECCKEMFNKG